ncbi:hypothetical protein SDC9_168545 [bioreactor metagenome]|uniref:Uncharacterized protein n=1 Tax=bioreactor metagenome TaxID=1076179 RepID=A0A645G4V6_9ZZZZ
MNIEIYQLCEILAALPFNIALELYIDRFRRKQDIVALVDSFSCLKLGVLEKQGSGVQAAAGCINFLAAYRYLGIHPDKVGVRYIRKRYDSLLRCRRIVVAVNTDGVLINHIGV